MITAGYHLSLQPGTRIEEYEILSVLGQGSFGITYLAEDTNLGARLAIKEYLPSDWAFRDTTQTVRPKSTDLEESFEKGQDAFLKEARLLAKVTHANIVKVRRFFRAHGTAYIAMDFIDGRSFGDVLKDDYPTGGYPAAALKQLLLSLLDGIGALHETGIIHRDIKPGNVVIAANRSPILVDFGAARHFDRTLMHGMTVIVTPGYAPIEQYSDDGEQGPYTDIYALGALAYRAIAGQAPDAPYKRLTGEGTTARISGAGKYPPEFLAAIDWAIAVQPKDRPQTAAVLAARLRDVSTDLPVAPEAPTRIMSDDTVALDPPSKRRGTPNDVAKIDQAPSPRPRGKTATPGPRAELPAVHAKAPSRRVGLLAAAALVLVIAAGAAVIMVPKLWTSSTVATTPSEPAKASADDAARKAVEEQAAAAAKYKAEQDAADAARAEAARQAAAKAEAERQAAAAAAIKAQQDAAAKATAVKKAQAAESGNSSAHVADARCTNILQTTQMMGAISDEDRTYLKDHCH